MPAKVESFDMGWSPATHQGFIRLKLVGTRDPLVLTNLPSDDFAAMALILQEPDVYVSPTGPGGWQLHTAPTAPG